MANRVSRFPIPGGDDGLWDEYEEPVNLLGLGNNTLKLYNDMGTLKLAQGRCGLDDSSSKTVCIVDAITTISIAALTDSLWAKVELSKTASTLNIEITSIAGASDPSALPASFTGGYDADKQGFYITATKRCIGLVWINAGSAIEGIINCLAGESYAGFATSDDADDYIYTHVLLNGDTPNYAKLGEENTFQQDQTFEGNIAVGGNLDLSGASLIFNVSTTETIAVSTNYTIAHGLSAIPSLVLVSLVCDSADLDYSADEEVPIYVPIGYVNRNYGVSVNTTNIIITTDSAALAVMRRDTTTFSYITMSKWKFKVRYCA
jgi:hypothetical protein